LDGVSYKNETNSKTPLKQKERTLVGSHFFAIALIFRELLCETARDPDEKRLRI